MAKQNKNAPESTLSERDAMDYLPAHTQLVYWGKKKVAIFDGAENMGWLCAVELK